MSKPCVEGGETLTVQYVFPLTAMKAVWKKQMCIYVKTGEPLRVLGQHKVLRCTALPCKDLAKDKRGFHLVAGTGAGKYSRKMLTNITLLAHLFDLCFSLTFISSLA